MNPYVLFFIIVSLYPGESPLDSNPLMWLLLIGVVLLFIAFWSHLEPEARKIMSWFILFCCIGCSLASASLKCKVTCKVGASPC